MKKREIIRQAQKIRLEQAKNEPNIPKKNQKDKMIYLLTAALLITLGGGMQYSSQVKDLKAELKKAKQNYSTETERLTPVKFAPYSVIHPEDICNGLIMEFDGERSCLPFNTQKI